MSGATSWGTKMHRVFRFVDVTRADGETERVVELGRALRRIPNRIPLMDGDGVYWTKDATYVMVEGDDFYHPELNRKVNVLSINGGGETRWGIKVAYDGTYYGAGLEDATVLRAFGLED